MSNLKNEHSAIKKEINADTWVLS